MEECLDLFSGQEQPTGCHTNAGLTRKNHALKKAARRIAGGSPGTNLAF